MKTEKKNNSAMRKLIPATSMLLVSAMMLASSTYAWFTMNKEVQVTGMEVKTKVGSNLLICSTNMEADYKSDVLSQSRQALLEPVSSINGTDGSFFYTVDAAADGKKIHGTTGEDAAFVFGHYSESTNYSNPAAGKTKYDTGFNGVYTILPSGTAPSGTGFNNGAPAYGYVDYTFYIKATGERASQPINMTTCNLVYSDSGSGTQSIGSGTGKTGEQAWRVAVFSSDVTSNGGKGYMNDPKPASDANNQKGLISLSGASNFLTGKAVNATSNSTTNGWLGDVVNNASANGVVIGTVDAGTTKYFKVTVRLWLEGEDTTCTSETYAALTNAYKLDLELKLDNTAVKNIGTDLTEATRIETKTPQTSGTNYDT